MRRYSRNARFSHDRRSTCTIHNTPKVWSVGVCRVDELHYSYLIQHLWCNQCNCSPYINFDIVQCHAMNISSARCMVKNLIMLWIHIFCVTLAEFFYKILRLYDCFKSHRVPSHGLCLEIWTATGRVSLLYYVVGYFHRQTTVCPCSTALIPVTFLVWELDVLQTRVVGYSLHLPSRRQSKYG